MIRAGYPVRLIEADEKALSAALSRIRRLLDEDVAALRAYQVYQILTEQDLLARSGPRLLPSLGRPPEPPFRQGRQDGRRCR